MSLPAGLGGGYGRQVDLDRGSARINDALCSKRLQFWELACYLG